MFTATLTHNGWRMIVHVSDNSITVVKDGESRVYTDLPHQMCGVLQNKEHPNYVKIEFEDSYDHLQFKFEDGNFLVGDIFTTIDDGDEEVHVREFVCHVFGEDDGLLDTNFTELEIEEFKNKWSQTHTEICLNLQYDEDDDGSSEMILGDGYFWLEDNWYPKCASTYTGREQAIADHIQL